MYQFQKDFLEYLRKVLLLKVGISSEFGFTKDVLEKIQSQADRLEMARVLKIIEIFQKAGSDLRSTSVASLPLELAAVWATESEPLRARSAKQSITEEKIASLPQQVEAPRNSNTLDLVKQHWPQVLEKIKDYNHSLVSSLKLAEPASVVGNELTLVFPYKFHKDAIDARKNRIVVDQVLEEVLGIKLMTKPILQKDWNGNDSGKDLIGSALKIMGGEVE